MLNYLIISDVLKGKHRMAFGMFNKMNMRLK